MVERRLFTSESVSEGHPDKIADQISDGILDAMDSELCHYSLCTIIKSLDYDSKAEIARIIYSKCAYFDSMDTFNKYIEISYTEWKSANNKPSAGGGGGRGDSSGNSGTAKVING